jgi:hypothetical protein
MINSKTAVKLLEIGDRILQIIDNQEWETMPRGDLQGVIEATIMSAYLLGKKGE